MKIYIDESGVFTIPADGKIYTSCIGALVIPKFQEHLVFENFRRLKGKWGDEEQEFKGSKLNESQVDSVIDILTETDCTFFASLVDMSLENLSAIEFHKKMQASEFTKTLDQMTYQSMKDDLIDLEN